MSYLDFDAPKYYRDAGYGANYAFEWRGRTDYGAPNVADVDYYLTSTTPTIGEWVDVSASMLNDGKPDVWRNLTVSKTDASNTVMLVVEVIGTDQFGNDQKEILRLKNADSTVAGRVAWDTVSSLRYKATGDATGVTFTLGHGDVLGLPRQITSESDVLVAISDTGGAGAGPTNELAAARTTNIDVELSTIEFEGNDPDGTDLFYVELRPTAPIGGTPPQRPRGEIVTVQSS